MNKPKDKLKPSIILLAGKGTSTNILYNGLKDSVVFKKVILEESPSKKIMFKIRVKKLGLIKAIGQVLFSLIIVTSLKKIYKNRIKILFEIFSFSDSKIPKSIVSLVKSVNSNKTRDLIESTDADFILVNGTRIIGEKTLGCTSYKFINIHTGITPKYRGVHGGYWALINKDLKSCGVTLHYVDKGVDTGVIIAQSLITPISKDSFVTYPFLQLNQGILLLEKFINTNLEQEKKLDNFGEELNSQQYYHPTIWGYLFNYFFKNIK
jgi:folate-dependent phosphoribosylglycinamide formyltransferase PurN